ncbi:GID complex subunit 4, VID24 [Actinomortierella wolfii]|nr:GID complex subunit 4, VID24 [Actinomortierella wolfii]
MPVFTQVCSADPVPSTTASVACTCSGLGEGTCTCGQHSNDPACASTAEDASQATSGLALLKHQAMVRQQQLLLQQQQRAAKKDPFAPQRLFPTTTFHLYPGSRFKGKQISGNNSYEVIVDIKHVSLQDSSLCGYLHINGLTEEYPELTTFFDAEIIGSKFKFLTRKWEADEAIDREHWSMFKPFERLSAMYCMQDFQYDFMDESVIFMRWKEHFLVPDHRVEGITGASFAGFYYICYNKLTGQINGYYYHQSSEK